jgi:choline dehydrogenase-like flavoprotein
VDEEVTNAILASAQKVGWAGVSDTNAHDDERIGFTPSTVKNGVRVSAASAFLRPVLKRPNLTYLTRAKVGYLLFDGTRITGVRARHGSTSRDYLSAKEVLVSAGTVESTLLLERSGIGRPDVLRPAGVDAVVESPNVGERVIEQRGVCMQTKLRGGSAGPRSSTRCRAGLGGAEVPADAPRPDRHRRYDLVCAFKSSPDVERPDIQGIWAAFAVDPTSGEAAALKLADLSGFLFFG